jgi:hypothetical protein
MSNMEVKKDNQLLSRWDGDIYAMRRCAVFYC